VTKPPIQKRQRPPFLRYDALYLFMTCQVKINLCLWADDWCVTSGVAWETKVKLMPWF